MREDSRSPLWNYLIGLCMGTADAVPGVSGGTIALIAGIYTQLITAITSLTPRNGLRILSALAPPDRKELRTVLDEMDIWFLLPLGAGILTAVILVTRGVRYANAQHPVVLFGFFFGLIAATVVVLARQIRLVGLPHYGAALTGFLLAFVLSGNVTLLEGHGVGLVFLAGAIAVSAMILPGLSGALILIILGQYVYLSERLAEFIDHAGAVLAGGSPELIRAPGTTVVIFVAGAVVGLVTIARGVEYALERAPDVTLAFLVSLVAGALRAPVTEIGRKGIDWTASTIETFVLAALIGAILLYTFDHYAIEGEIETGRAAAQ